MNEGGPRSSRATGITTCASVCIWGISFFGCRGCCEAQEAFEPASPCSGAIQAVRIARRGCRGANPSHAHDRLIAKARIQPRHPLCTPPTQPHPGKEAGLWSGSAEGSQLIGHDQLQVAALIPASHLLPGGIKVILPSRPSLYFDNDASTLEVGYGISKTALS